ncbi:MAG: hypothetical protein ABR575_00260 [Actinomycetota bacterium]
MPLARAIEGWPEEFLRAIPVGADLSLVWPRFALWLLTDPEWGASRHARGRTKGVLARVVALYERWSSGDKPSRQEWISAAYAAYAAYAAAHQKWMERAADELLTLLRAAPVVWIRPGARRKDITVDSKAPLETALV